jgi:hypothetical protein
MRWLTIDAHPQYLDIEPAELGKAIAKAAGFFRTPGSVILWIKVEDDFLPFEIAERNLVPVLVERRKIRRRCSNL